MRTASIDLTVYVTVPVSLSHNTDLEKLTLDFGSCVAPADIIQVLTTDSEGSLLRTLSTLNTPRLHTLVLQLHAHVPAGITLRSQLNSNLHNGSDVD